MRRTNRIIYIILGITFLVVVVGALVLGANPQLFGTASLDIASGGSGNVAVVEQADEAEEEVAEQDEDEEEPEAPPPDEGETDDADNDNNDDAGAPSSEPTAIAQEVATEVVETQVPPSDQPAADEAPDDDPDGDGITGTDDECPDQGTNVGGDGCPLVGSEPTAIPPTAVPAPPIPDAGGAAVEAPPSPTPYDVPPTPQPTELLVPERIGPSETPLVPPTLAGPPTVEMVAPPTVEQLVPPTVEVVAPDDDDDDAEPAAPTTAPDDDDDDAEPAPADLPSATATPTVAVATTGAVQADVTPPADLTPVAAIQATNQAVVAAIPQGETLTIYEVQPGDSVGGIAQNVSQTVGRQVTVEEIEAINSGIIDPDSDLILPGEIVLVPAPLEAVEEDEGLLGLFEDRTVECFPYTLQPGDTFESLAALASESTGETWTATDLRLLNRDTNVLEAGNSFCLPRVDRGDQTPQFRAGTPLETHATAVANIAATQAARSPQLAVLPPPEVIA